ncbi:MAG: GNAT family N-acetyltransferase [bacterium]|nr:GNAT family N-acetyltransferase [bacterium]
MLVAEDKQALGFVALARHNDWTYEIHSMGVMPEFHQRGIGRALVGAAEGLVTQANAKYLTVKTLSSQHPDPNYANTRKFYSAVGFEPLEEFPTLWGAGTPCLMMVKSLAG